MGASGRGIVVPRRLAVTLLGYAVVVGLSVGSLLWVGLRGPELISVGTGTTLSRGTVTGFFATVLTLLFVVIPLAATWSDRLPATRFPLPNQEYWKVRQNRDAFRLRFLADVLRLCTLAAVAATAVMLGAVRATLTGGFLPLWSLGLAALCLLLAVVLVRRMWSHGYRISGQEPAA